MTEDELKSLIDASLDEVPESHDCDYVARPQMVAAIALWMHLDMGAEFARDDAKHMQLEAEVIAAGMVRVARALRFMAENIPQGD